MPKVEKIKTSKIDRPDKAAFSLFIGSFLLIAFFVAAYGANYFYRVYQINIYTLKFWQQNPKNIPDYLPANDLLYSQSTRIDNARLQAILCAAASLVLLICAVLLFVRAFKIYQRIKNAAYNETDWRSFDKPAAKMEVIYSRVFNFAAIFLYIFFGGITLLAVITSIKPDGIRLRGIVVGLFNIVLLGIFYYLRNNGEKKSVKYFDSSGVVRKDGNFFLWSDFRGVAKRIGRMHYGGKMVYRTELIFGNGVVWLIGQRIKNYDEVNKFVETLPEAALTET